MALNVDKNRQIAGYTSTPTSQQRAEQSATSSQPSVFSSSAKKENALYTVKKGDTLWKIAKEQLIASGNERPSNTDIYNAMLQIAKANGCSTVDECSQKFFYQIGNELNLQGLFGNPKPEPVVEETPIEPETPVLIEQETKIKEELKSKFPNLGLQNMTDSEVKAFLDKLKETNPELLSVLESAVSTQGAEEVASTEEVSEQPQTTGLTDTQMRLLEEQLTQFISEHPEAVTERSTTSQPSVAQSEIEQLAQKIGRENDSIDNIIADLKTKQTRGSELSADEARLLSLYDEQQQKEPNVSNPKSDKSIADLAKKLINSGFMDKPSEEKMSMMVDSYLTKHEDPTLLGLETQEEKVEYVNKVIAELLEMSKPASTDTTDEAASNKAAGFRMSMLLKAAEEQHLTIDDLRNLTPEQREKMISDSGNELVHRAINELYDNIDQEKLAGLPYEDRVHVYADAILTMVDTDGKYASMSEEQKAEYRETAIAKFAKEQIGIDLSELDPVMKASLYSRVAQGFEKVRNGGTLADIASGVKLSKTPMARARDVYDGFKAQRAKGSLSGVQEDAMLTAWAECELADKLEAMGVKDDPPKLSDAIRAYEALIAEANDRGYSPAELQRLELLKNQAINYSNTNKDKNEGLYVSYIGNKDVYLSESGQTTVTNDEMLNYLLGEDYEFNDLDPNKDNYNEESFAKLKEFVTNARPEEMETLIGRMAQSGMSVDEINSCLSNVFTQLGEGQYRIDAFAKFTSMINDPKQMERWLVIGRDTQAESLGNVVEDLPRREEYTVEDNIGFGTIIGEDAQLRERYSIGLHEYRSHEDNVSIISGISNSGELSDSAVAQFNQTFVQTAQTDEDKLYYGMHLAETTDNAAALEGIAAASNSISDTNMRNQYNSSVTTSAQKFPPEQQNNINTAMQTGKISNETLSKTTPPASSSNSTSSSSTTSSTGSSSQVGQSSYTSSSSKSQSAATTTPSSATSRTSATISTTLSQDAASSIAASNNAKRQAAMDNAKSTAQSIEEAVEDWNKKHSKQLTVDDIDAVKAASALEAAREAIESSATSESEKERILNALANATSVGEIYDILVGALGASKVQDKFIDILASSGSSSNIKAFVASRAGDSDSLVKQFFLRTSSSSLKKELLGMLSADSVAELLANKQISDLTSVDQRILISYVMKNIHLMSNTEFARFLNAIADPFEKEKLITIRTGVSLLKSNSKQQSGQQSQVESTAVETAQTGEAPAVQPAPQAFSFAQQPLPQEPVNPEAPAAQPQPKLARGEMSKDMGDGTILTREGAGFGAISNTDFDLTRIVQKPEHKDGAPIGMEDKTFTVGSAEWNKKYNRNNVQSTAFTLAALEDNEDDTFGGAWFGNKGNFKGKKIDKKSGLRFNA